VLALILHGELDVPPRENTLRGSVGELGAEVGEGEFGDAVGFMLGDELGAEVGDGEFGDAVGSMLGGELGAVVGDCVSAPSE
jgi:hypothetical protein